MSEKPTKMMGRLELVIALCFYMTAAENCEFPEFLTKKPRWESGITNEHRTTDHHYRFVGSLLEHTNYMAEEKVTFTWTCKIAFQENRFLMKLDKTKSGDDYACMQFIQRSPYIVQRKFSSTESVYWEDLCDDENLALDDWPLIWPQLNSGYAACPFVGGYSFEIREHILHDVLCYGNLKPRMESECITGEGITINFRNFQCIGDLSMNLVQQVMCMGIWEDGNHMFTVLTNRDDAWPKLWLLRIEKKEGHSTNEPLKAIISKDILSDTSEIYGKEGLVPLERVYDLMLNNELFPSLCENEADKCDLESSCGDNAIFCQKQCGVCEIQSNIDECTFHQSTRGEWREISASGGSRDISITTSMLYVDGLMPYHCYELYADRWYEGTGRKALTTIYRNGCKPRYTCVELNSLSPNVMSYRLSQSLVWPATLNVNAEDVCNPGAFRNDELPLGNQVDNEVEKLLVRKEDSTNRHTYVPCNFPNSYSLNGTRADGSAILGVMWNTVENQVGMHESILHETCVENENMPFYTSRKLNCLASFQLKNETKVVVVKDQDNPQTIECWIVHQYEWQSHPKIYVVHPSDCNANTPIQIDFAHHTNFIAKYDLIPVNKEETHPCNKWVKTRFDTDTQSKQFTTPLESEDIINIEVIEDKVESSRNLSSPAETYPISCYLLTLTLVLAMLQTLSIYHK